MYICSLDSKKGNCSLCQGSGLCPFCKGTGKHPNLEGCDCPICRGKKKCQQRINSSSEQSKKAVI
jgi:hypothetical protein